MNVNIIDINENQLDEVCELSNSVEETEDSYIDKKEAFKKMLTNNPCIGAYVDGKLAGFMLTRYRRDSVGVRYKEELDKEFNGVLLEVCQFDNAILDETISFEFLRYLVVTYNLNLLNIQVVLHSSNKVLYGVKDMLGKIKTKRVVDRLFSASTVFFIAAMINFILFMTANSETSRFVNEVLAVINAGASMLLLIMFYIIGKSKGLDKKS